ncbi:hypothetical protein CRM22_005556, partial [Opisthorchis felineus]
MDEFVLNIKTNNTSSRKQRKTVFHPCNAKKSSDVPTPQMPAKKVKLKAKRDGDGIPRKILRSKSSPSTTNPLQFVHKSDEPRTSSRDGRTDEVTGGERISALMQATVEPRIEPVFSEKLWKPFCDSLGVQSFITSCLVDRFKLTRLTAIQKEAIPHLLEGKDCLIRAQTGSGKTLAYAVPLFHQLMSLEPPISRTDGTLALVILPTRELATQTFEVFQLLGKACVRIVPGCLIGGMKRKSQKVSLSKGLNILVGTPQRILDHILRSVNLSLSKLLYLVIDEADRLLEMGFEQSVRRIIDHIREVSNAIGKTQSLQTVLLSATLTP